MNKQRTDYSFLFGRFVVRASAFHRLNLWDVYRALLRHALGTALPLCPVLLPTTRLSFWARQRYATTHQDRQGTAFWIVTEPDLSRTIILLANE
ncbi:MAG TPA: hypothetical protein VI136_03675 [Verrucomicrobiae bacterium]